MDLSHSTFWSMLSAIVAPLLLAVILVGIGVTAQGWWAVASQPQFRGQRTAAFSRLIIPSLPLAASLAILLRDLGSPSLSLVLTVPAIGSAFSAVRVGRIVRGWRSRLS